MPFATVFRAANKAKAPVVVDADFDRDFDYEFVSAHPNKELVFFNKPERTLIEADFLFNLPATEQFSKTKESPTAGILTRLFVRLNSTQGAALGQKRFLWWAISSRDRKSYNESVKRVDGWDFDRIVPCHGDVIETGGKGVFRKVMQWHLEAGRKGQ